MPCAANACAQARASAICPIAAAAWLSSSFSAPLAKAARRPPERDRPRRDDENVGAAPMQRGEIGDQRVEPFLFQRALRPVDEQRGADFDDDAVEAVEGGLWFKGASGMMS